MDELPSEWVSEGWDMEHVYFDGDSYNDFLDYLEDVIDYGLDDVEFEAYG